MTSRIFSKNLFTRLSPVNKSSFTVSQRNFSTHNITNSMKSNFNYNNNSVFNKYLLASGPVALAVYSSSDNKLDCSGNALIQNASLGPFKDYTRPPPPDEKRLNDYNRVKKGFELKYKYYYNKYIEFKNFIDDEKNITNIEQKTCLPTILQWVFPFRSKYYYFINNYSIPIEIDYISNINPYKYKGKEYEFIFKDETKLNIMPIKYRVLRDFLKSELSHTQGPMILKSNDCPYVYKDLSYYHKEWVVPRFHIVIYFLMDICIKEQDTETLNDLAKISYDNWSDYNYRSISIDQKNFEMITKLYPYYKFEYCDNDDGYFTENHHDVGYQHAILLDLVKEAYKSENYDFVKFMLNKVVDFPKMYDYNKNGFIDFVKQCDILDSKSEYIEKISNIRDAHFGKQ